VLGRLIEFSHMDHLLTLRWTSAIFASNCMPLAECRISVENYGAPSFDRRWRLIFCLNLAFASLNTPYRLEQSLWLNARHAAIVTAVAPAPSLLVLYLPLQRRQPRMPCDETIKDGGQ
jgi:hypothetical protein